GERYISPHTKVLHSCFLGFQDSFVTDSQLPRYDVHLRQSSGAIEQSWITAANGEAPAFLALQPTNQTNTRCPLASSLGSTKPPKTVNMSVLSLNRTGTRGRIVARALVT